MLLKPQEMVVPKPLIMRDPVPHGLKPRGHDTVATLPAAALLGYKSGIEQDAKMLGDGWAAYLEMSRDRVDRAVGLDEEIEHPAPRGMTNCGKDIGLAIGSHHHAASIGKNMLTCQGASRTLARLRCGLRGSRCLTRQN